jgi:hypothetical protein
MTMKQLAQQLERQAASIASAVAKAEIGPNTASVPGLAYAPASGAPTPIIALAETHKLGTAARKSYLTHANYAGRELRVDMEVSSEATGDSLPPNRVILHATERVAKRIVEDAGDHEWSASKRRTIDAHTVSRFWRATVVPSGSYQAAKARDAAAAARRGPKPAKRPPTPPNKVGAANQMNGSFWAERQGGSR